MFFKKRVNNLFLIISGKEFTFREYVRHPKAADLGKRIMYRDAHMKGWAYKTLQSEDLKMPVITGQGKRVSFKCFFFVFCEKWFFLI